MNRHSTGARRSRWLLPVLLPLLLLPGCAQLPLGRGSGRLPPLPADIAAVYRDYQQARAAAGTPPTRLDALHARFDRALMAAVHRAEGEDAILQALDLLDGGVARFPKDRRLIQERSRLTRKRLSLVRHNDYQLLVEETRHARRLIDLFEERRKLQGLSLTEQWTLGRARERLARAPARLLACAREGIASDEPALAQACLDLAEELRNRDYVADLRARWIATFRPPPTTHPSPGKKPPAHASHGRIELLHLRRQLYRKLGQGDLLAARRLLARLIRLDRHNPEWRDLKQSLDAAVRARVESLHEQASALYSKQRIRAARQLWQEILRLDPHNTEARNLLQRSERILQKLEQLKQQKNHEPQAPAPAEAGRGRVVPRKAPSPAP